MLNFICVHVLVDRYTAARRKALPKQCSNPDRHYIMLWCWDLTRSLKTIDLGHIIESFCLACISINIPNCILKLNSVSDKRYLYIFILISKKCLSTQPRLFGSNPDFWTSLKYEQNIESIRSLFYGIHILRYYGLRIVWVILPKTPFSNLKLTEKHDMSGFMTKLTKWHVRPAKTQISLGIRPI